MAGMEQGELYTTHLNRGYCKRILVNAGIGLAVAGMCANAYFSAAGAGVMTLIGVIFGLVFFALAVLTVIGARHPLRLTEAGIVTRYFITPPRCIPWADIAGIGTHPRRKEPCLLRRSAVEGAEPQPVTIGWSLIGESQAEVMDEIKAQLTRHGHVFEEEQVEPEQVGEARHFNPLKEFWS